MARPAFRPVLVSAARRAGRSAPVLWRAARAVLRRRARLIAWFAAVLAPLLLFGELAEEVWEGEGFAWDAPLAWALRSVTSPHLDGFALTLGVLGGFAVVAGLALLAALFSWSRNRPREVALFLVGVGGAGLLNVLAKLAFRRERPDLWTPLAPEHDFGFPSGHAMVSLAFAVSALVLLWRTRWRPAGVLLVVLALLVGMSRVVLGVHWPSDVLAGWAASAAWVLGVARVLRPWRPRLARRGVPPAP